MNYRRLTYLGLGLFLGILIACEVLRKYLIFPFPGSQELSGTLDIAYFLNKNIIFIRIILGIGLVVASWSLFKAPKLLPKIIFSVVIGLYLFVFYQLNFVFIIEEFFLLPDPIVFKKVNESIVPHEKVIIGISHGEEALAFPIELISYHHQVPTELGDSPILATYCSVCRTGRVYESSIEGKPMNFEILGMHEYNALLKDIDTGSWWQQVTGEAVAGPLKGKKMKEVFSEQMTLSSWLRIHPHTQILQPDTNFQEKYEEQEGYDRGIATSTLERTDSLSWQDKSWVIGIDGRDWARAYDYLQLREKEFIQDTPESTPLIITLEKDSLSFHVWSRELNGQVLSFAIEDSTGLYQDEQTASLWDKDGNCIEGQLIGQKLEPIQGYLEYWHSWRTFRPYTDRFE